MDAQRTVGIDLASQPAGTGLVELVWSAGGAEVVTARLGADDAELLAAAEQAGAVGIDAPFGWPAAFVDQVAAWHGGDRWGDAAPPELTHRRTDHRARAACGRLPLSVSADRLAYVGFRAARLLTALAGRRGLGRPIDRTGADGVVETWPVGSLRCWDRFEPGHAKAGPDGSAVRAGLLAGLGRAVPLAVPRRHRAALVDQPDVFDALLAGLGARAAQVGATAGPGPDDVDLARVEGWIHLPRPGSLDELTRPSVA